MNDGVDGFAIIRFDLSADSVQDDDHTAVRSAPPALVRFEASIRRFFAAIGTKIMAMHSDHKPHVVPVFDVRTRRVTLLGAWCEESFPCEPVYMAVGDKLLVLDKYCAGMLYPPCEGMDWAWLELPNDFFMLQGITSYALHPDGQTVFVSVKTATFSLDTESEHPEWRFHGDWELPFTRRGHFDPGLDAWVGLSSDPDTLGYICSCDVVSTDFPDASRNTQPPAWKLSKEKLFCVNSAEHHIGANLVYMGRARGFCLVQYFHVEDLDMDDVSSSSDSDYELEQFHHFRLRLTTFSLKYDDKGDLCTETPCRVRCYQLPRASKILCFRNPPAFWM
jgi:hypothetical protein